MLRSIDQRFINEQLRNSLRKFWITQFFVYYPDVVRCNFHLLLDITRTIGMLKIAKFMTRTATIRRVSITDRSPLDKLQFFVKS